MLVSHWPLHEDSGSIANDVRGSYDGTVNGATQGVTGVLGATAYDFNGTSDYINVPNSLASVFGSGSFSISMWASSINNGHLVDNRDETSGFVGFVLRYTSGALEFTIDDGSTDEIAVETNNTFTDGNLYHVVAIRDNGNDDLRIFVDAEEQAKTFIDGGSPSSYGSIANSVDTQIAAQKNEQDSSFIGHLDGTVSEVRIYDHALTPSGVQYLYDVSQRGRYLPEVQTS